MYISKICEILHLRNIPDIFGQIFQRGPADTWGRGVWLDRKTFWPKYSNKFQWIKKNVKRKRKRVLRILFWEFGIWYPEKEKNYLGMFFHVEPQITFLVCSMSEPPWWWLLNEKSYSFNCRKNRKLSKFLDKIGHSQSNWGQFLHFLWLQIVEAKLNNSRRMSNETLAK